MMLALDEELDFFLRYLHSFFSELRRRSVFHAQTTHRSIFGSQGAKELRIAVSENDSAREV
jgi:hypothetical protein